MFKVRGLILSFICVLSLPGFVSGAKQQPSAGLSRQMKRLHEYERLQRVLEESNPKLCEQFVLLSEKVMARAKLAAQDKKAIQAFLKKVASDQNVNQRDKKSITQFLRPGLSTGAQVGIGVGSAAAVVAALAGLAIAARKGVSLGIKSALSGFTPLPTGGASLVGAGAAADRGTGAGAGLGEDGPVGADGLPVMPVLPSSIAVEQRSGDPAAALGVDIGAAVVGVVSSGSAGAGAGLGAGVVALDKRQRFIKMLLEFRRELQKLTINPTQINQPDPYNPGEVISDFYREMAAFLVRYAGSFESLKRTSFQDYLTSCGYTVNVETGGCGYFRNLALICKKDAKGLCVKIVGTPVTSTLMAHRVANFLPGVYSDYRRRIATNARGAGATEQNSFIPVEPAYSYLVKLQCGEYVQLQESVTAGRGFYKRVPLLDILTPDVIDQLILVESLIATYDMHADNVGYVYRPDGTAVVKLFDLERIGYLGEVTDKQRAPSAKKYFIRLILGQYKNNRNRDHIDAIQARYPRVGKNYATAQTS